MIKTHNNKKGYTKLCSHPLPCTPIYSHPLLLIFNPLPLIFGSSPPTPTHLYLSPTHLKPMPDHLQTLLAFPMHIQMLIPNPTQHLPFQPIFSPCILRAYVLYRPVCLREFVFHVLMCLWNLFLCTLLPMSMYFKYLCVC